MLVLVAGVPRRAGQFLVDRRVGPLLAVRRRARRRAVRVRLGLMMGRVLFRFRAPSR
jgi:hypothetical protein